MASVSEHYSLAVTLPCCNDTSFLLRAVKLLEQATHSEEGNFVLVIAEDGSDSSDVVGRLMSEYQNILYFHNSERLGRGKAIMEAWRRVNADIYLFMDADMSTDLFQMGAYSNLVRKVREEHFDLVTGSRYHPDSKAYRPIIRWIASIVYNKIVRLLFRSEVSDHQCGFKAFSAQLIRALSDVVKSDSWFWDTEIIIIAQKKGFKVTEIPVFWVEMKGPSTPLRRLFKDIWLHGTGILGLSWRVHFGGLDFNAGATEYGGILGRRYSLRKQKADHDKWSTRLNYTHQYREWNETMSQKYSTERLYFHPNPAIRYIENKRVQVILDLVATTDGCSVLDIGCGEAHITKRLHGDVVAIDLSSSALYSAKTRLRVARCAAELVLADAQHLPFRDRSFDKAVCSETLEHVLSPFRLLSEASRVVRGGGMFVVTLPNEQNINRLKSLLRKFGLFKLLLKNVPDRMDQEWHLHVFDQAHARRMIESSGFDIVRTVIIPPLVSIRWVFLCGKPKADLAPPLLQNSAGAFLSEDQANDDMVSLTS